MRDVHDLLCLLGQAQVEVVILTAVELCPLVAAHLCQQRRAEHAQVADIVVGAQVIQHIIRLEVVDRQVVDVPFKGHFVGVHKVRALLGNGFRHIPQCTGVQDVVMVQQSDIFTRGKSKALIGVARNALVAVQFPVADAAVGAGTLLHKDTHVRVLSGIHHAQLPVAVGLVLHRVQQLHQKIVGGVVQRHHDADARCSGLVCGLLYQQFHVRKAVGGHGLAREQLFILPLGLGLCHYARKAHPAQGGKKDEEREGAPQLAALAYQIPQRPAGLPEGGVDHAVQGLFQVLLVAAAQGKVAAQPLQLGSLFGGGALGLHSTLPQNVQLLFIARLQLRQLRGSRAAEQRRQLLLAAVLPCKLPAKALCGKLLCAVCHTGVLIAHQHHLFGLHGGQGDPLRVCHHQQLRAALRHRGIHFVKSLFQQAAVLQHLHTAGCQFPHDALCQCTAALGGLLILLFLIQLHADTPIRAFFCAVMFPVHFSQTDIVYQILRRLRRFFQNFSQIAAQRNNPASQPNSPPLRVVRVRICAPV